MSSDNLTYGSISAFVLVVCTSFTVWVVDATEDDLSSEIARIQGNQGSNHAYYEGMLETLREDLREQEELVNALAQVVAGECKAPECEFITECDRDYSSRRRNIVSCKLKMKKAPPPPESVVEEVKGCVGCVVSNKEEPTELMFRGN